MNEVNMPRLADVWTVPHFTVTARNVLASNKLNSAAQPSFEGRSSRLQVRTQQGRLRSLLRVVRKQTRINCAFFPRLYFFLNSAPS